VCPLFVCENPFQQKIIIIIIIIIVIIIITGSTVCAGSNDETPLVGGNGSDTVKVDD
jgi:flagellar biosynthesis/type III secretory pathway M-ring protein FliF/YscJ